MLTPEKSIQLQISYGADVVFCLDWCTDPQDPREVQEQAVALTLDWAKRCKIEFEKRIAVTNVSDVRPLLFAVVQGGENRDLRKSCLEGLMQMGFDGFGYGGYPIDVTSHRLVDSVKYTRALMPGTVPAFALGVGSPENVVSAFDAGYDLFDSSYPTRDARRGILYGLRNMHAESLHDLTFSYLYVKDKKFIKDGEPISTNCDCLVCEKYSRAYLHHLFRRKDPSYVRLATIHNLRTMILLITQLRRIRRRESS